MLSKAQEERETSLILDNMGLVISLAKNFKPPNDTELEEYVQAGRIGCMKAARTWDESKSKFGTWAYQHIRWEIIRHINGKLNKFVSLSKIADPGYTDDPNTLLESMPDCLTEQERQLITLRIYSYTLKEISDTMKINTYTIGKLLQSAVEKIREANRE